MNRDAHWRVGELAKAWKVSIRTVSHYCDGHTLPHDISLILETFFSDNPIHASARDELSKVHKLATEERARPRAARIKKPRREQARAEVAGNIVELRFSRLLVRVPRDFLGRKTNVTEITDILRSPGMPVRTAILYGMRGVGKTTLAAAYAAEHEADYPRVWSVRAETATTAMNDLIDLGEMMGWLPHGIDLEQRAQFVLDQVAQHGRGLLLIYDNALSLQSIAPLLPRVGECHVIITSTVNAWRGVGDPVEIKVWPPDVGANFLVERTGQRRSFADARKLSKALEGLPLAHEVAGSYCENLELPMIDYLASFNANPLSLLNDGRYSPIQYYGGIAISKAFEMAIRAANKASRACALVICYASLLPPDAVPHCLFTLGAASLADSGGNPFSEGDMVEAIAVLRSFSLISYASVYSGNLRDYEEDRPQMFQIHRLTRIVAVEYGLNGGIFTKSPEDTLIAVVKCAFTKCGFFQYERRDGGSSNYSLILHYSDKLAKDSEFAGKISDQSKQYLSKEYANFMRNVDAWPH